jgi:hypothetical protein
MCPCRDTKMMGPYWPALLAVAPRRFTRSAMGRTSVRRAIVPGSSGSSIAPPIAEAHRRALSGCGLVDHLLVVATVAVFLGMSALTASLAPFASDRHDVAWRRPPVVIDRGHAPRLVPSPDGSAWPPAGGAIPAARRWGRTGGLWSSSLQPPTDATTEAGLAHAGATASSRDPRAFLMDAAIQIHAPSSAPAPRRRAAPPHPHGVD